MPGNTDIGLAVQQNGVNALSQIYQALVTANDLWAKQIGSETSGNLSANALVYDDGPVRVTGISVLGGSGSAWLHDVDDIANITADTRIYAIPTTVGFYPLNIITTLGLAFEIDTGNVVVITYGPET